MEYYLGIDPSTKCTGFCVMNKQYDIIESGKIMIPENGTEAEKIFYQVNEIEKLFQKYEFQNVLIEDQFAKTNIDTLKKLSKTAGAYLFIGYKYTPNISTIYPTSWRKVFHGNGRAKKRDTFDKVCAIYEFTELKYTKDNDLTDAIGICWAAVDIHKEGAAA